jgi:catechol 1,2-dioxygenase
MQTGAVLTARKAHFRGEENMSYVETELTEECIGRLASAKNERLREIVAALTRHLHNFIREVKPTDEEWMQGIQFLTGTGQMCNEVRQEYILLSDVLGVSMLMDAINHEAPDGITESSVLGPFYRPGAPEFEMGASISGETEGDFIEVSGRVLDPDGKPIAGAILDIWHTAPNGLYEVQDPNQPDYNLRGRFRTGADGAYSFTSVAPVSYPIPDDGPVGKLLRAVGRHPYRPAHFHFIISAEGYKPVVTQIFASGNEYIESDAVFGVKHSLIVDFEKTAAGYAVHFDFNLSR